MKFNIVERILLPQMIKTAIKQFNWDDVCWTYN